MLFMGGCIGFWQGSGPQLLSDIAMLQPAVLVAVPRVLMRIYTKVMTKVRQWGLWTPGWPWCSDGGGALLVAVL
jgi:long-subunit acyl-CoA synthetase (AMP-forming)